MHNLDQSKNEIEAMLRSMFEAWNRHDMEAYCANWTEELNFVNVIGGRARTRQHLRAELEWLHSDRFHDSELILRDHTIRFLSPDIAVLCVEWQMLTDRGFPGFPAPADRRGIFTHVAQRTAEGWKLIASQNTDVNAEALKMMPQASIAKVG